MFGLFLIFINLCLIFKDVKKFPNLLFECVYTSSFGEMEIKSFVFTRNRNLTCFLTFPINFQQLHKIDEFKF